MILILKKEIGYFHRILVAIGGRATLEEHLAKGIPALSQAAGRVAIGLGKDNEINMANLKNNGWGRTSGTLSNRWLHSDLKDMAYLYVESLFSDIFVEKGILK
jgi:hypothetical protein